MLARIDSLIRGTACSLAGDISDLNTIGAYPQFFIAERATALFGSGDLSYPTHLLDSLQLHAEVRKYFTKYLRRHIHLDLFRIFNLGWIEFTESRNSQ